MEVSQVLRIWPLNATTDTLHRKKYRKMKHRFDDRMEEANELFLATWRAEQVARRIKEQNECAPPPISVGTGWHTLTSLLIVNYLRS